MSTVIDISSPVQFGLHLRHLGEQLGAPATL
jgi:hypothetical protein